MSKRKARPLDIENGNSTGNQFNLRRNKRTRVKELCVEQSSINKQIDNNNPGDAMIFTTLEPVPLDQPVSMEDRNDSPPPLVIDIPKEPCSSQSVMSDYFPPTEPIGERLPISAHNVDKTNHNLPKNASNVLPNDDYDIDGGVSNKECGQENITPITNRITNEHRTPSVHSQVSTPRIVVSVDRRRLNSNENFNYNQRTSTPIRPSRGDQVAIDSLAGECTDSYSIDDIPKETYEILSRFPEFRRLVKAFNNEKKKCFTWAKDFSRLQRNYQQLEQNSFPRPPAEALLYLVDLVNQIQRTSGRGDPRTDEQVAHDLGESVMLLKGLKDDTPQQTALNLFNHLYPGYEAKVQLGSTTNLMVAKPGLLETILVFAQRSAPGTNYKLQDLKDVFNNSIRGARYHWRRIQHSLMHVTPLNEQQNDNGVNDQVEHHFD